MRPALAIDIETIPDQDLMDRFLPPPDVALGNLKDPAKIEEKIAAAKRQQIDEAALNPHLARIVSIHFAERQKERNGPSNRWTIGLWDSQTIPEAGEQPGFANDWKELFLIDRFWKYAATHFEKDDARIVTFNGASFDIPFILRRSLLLGISPTVEIETNKYRVTSSSSNHIDIRRVLAETMPGAGLADFAPGNLDYYGKLLIGKGKKEGCDGRLVAEWYAAGNYQNIIEYGEHDVAELTLPIYNKLEGFYFS